MTDIPTINTPPDPGGLPTTDVSKGEVLRLSNPYRRVVDVHWATPGWGSVDWSALGAGDATWISTPAVLTDQDGVTPVGGLIGPGGAVDANAFTLLSWTWQKNAISWDDLRRFPGSPFSTVYISAYDPTTIIPGTFDNAHPDFTLELGPQPGFSGFALDVVDNARGGLTILVPSVLGTLPPTGIPAGWSLKIFSATWVPEAGDAPITISQALCSRDAGPGADWAETVVGGVFSAISPTSMLPLRLASWIIQSNSGRPSLPAGQQFLTGLTLCRKYFDLTAAANRRLFSGVCAGNKLGARDPTKNPDLGTILHMRGDTKGGQSDAVSFAKNRIDGAVWTASPALLPGPVLPVCNG